MVSKHSCAKLYQDYHHVAVSPSVRSNAFQLMSISTTTREIIDASRGCSSSPKSLFLSLHSFHVQLHVVFLSVFFLLKFMGQNLAGKGAGLGWSDQYEEIQQGQSCYISGIAADQWRNSRNLAPYLNSITDMLTVSQAAICLVLCIVSITATITTDN